MGYVLDDFRGRRTYPFYFYFEMLKNVSILIKNLTLFIYGKEED